MRNTFINELVNLARENHQIALIVGDLGYSAVEPFAYEFPNRFINAGVAEQNMASVAAGMASEGYHVFAYSIANFPTFRCAEQIRNDIDYHQFPVTIVAVGGGVAYGSLGYSHHAIQDYALMRSMPNMLIAAPGDPTEVRECLRFLVKNPQPSYLRLGKAGEPKFHTDAPILQPGRWQLVHKGNQPTKALLTTGTTLCLAMQWKDLAIYTDYSVYSLPLWGMSCKSGQAKKVKEFEKIITIEDHLIDGGMGSWLLESLASDPNLRAQVECRALNSKICGQVGSQQFLQIAGGLFSL